MKKTRIGSQEQENYIIAKAVYEETSEAVALEEKMLLEVSPDATDEQLDALCEQEEAIHQAHQMFQVTQQLHEAETALLSWGVTRLAHEPGMSNQLQLDITNMATNPAYRDRVVALFMRIK